MLEKNNVTRIYICVVSVHTFYNLHYTKNLKKLKINNWKSYLLDTEELDPLRFSLEVPFLKLVVLEPLYFDVAVLVDLVALSKICK